MKRIARELFTLNEAAKIDLENDICSGMKYISNNGNLYA
jgi:hypothetical protein